MVSAIEMLEVGAQDEEGDRRKNGIISTIDMNKFVNGLKKGLISREGKKLEIERP